MMFKASACALVALATTIAHGAVIYTNTTQTGSRYNPTPDTTGAPRIAFDDVLIPAANYGANSVFEITKVSIGLRRAGVNSPAQQISLYHSQFVGNTIDMPVNFANFQIPQSGPTTAFVTEVWSVGDGVNTLFTTSPNETIAPGFGAFAIGVRMGDTSSNTGWRVTSGPDANINAGWTWDFSTNTAQGPFVFSGATPPAVTMYLTVEGNFVPAPGVMALMTACGLAATRRRR